MQKRDSDQTSDPDLLKESDRGAVLVGACILEEQLEKSFTRLFSERISTNRLQREIFDYSGPLGTFSAKIKLSYALGLISKETYSNLEIVRKLRNKVAHGKEPFSFSSESAIKLVNSFTSTESVKNGIPIFHGDSKTSEPLSDAQIEISGYVKLYKVIFVACIMKTQIAILKESLAYAIILNPSSHVSNDKSSEI